MSVATPALSRVESLALALAAEGDAAALPAYVVDHADLHAHVSAIRSALPTAVELHYAAKANPDAQVLATLAPLVDGVEVASGGELAHVRQAVPDRPVAFGGPGKTPAEVAAALRAGVHRVHVESVHELRLLAETAARLGMDTDVLLRVNLRLDEAPGGGPALARHALDGVALAMGGRPTPFGLDPADLDACLAVLEASPRLRLRGVHAHLASGLDAGPALAVARGIVTWAIGWARTHGLALDEVDVGGGMAVDYADPHARFDWAAYGEGLGTLAAEHPGLTLRIEPGRAVTAYAGAYVTRVLDVKRSGGRAFAVVAGGTHHMRTPAAKQHDHPFTVLPVEQWSRPWERPGAADEPVTLVGQLCTPKDVLARDVPVRSVRADDVVVFAMAGAYAWNISHRDFLMHPPPTFHHLPADQVHLLGGPCLPPTDPLHPLGGRAPET